MRDARVADRHVRNGRLVRPILKWAGGKRQLLPELRPFYPKRFDRYVEPFLGSGAVFLDLHNGGFLEGGGVRLSGIHAGVIGWFRAVGAPPGGRIRAPLAPGNRAPATSTAPFLRGPDGH